MEPYETITYEEYQELVIQFKKKHHDKKTVFRKSGCMFCERFRYTDSEGPYCSILRRFPPIEAYGGDECAYQQKLIKRDRRYHKKRDP